MLRFSTLLLAILATTSTTTSFAFVIQHTTVTPHQSTTSCTTTTSLNGLMDAFKNDDSLGKPQNAGLSKGPNYNDNVTVNGKAVKGSVVGQKLTVVAGRARVKIPVNCQRGTAERARSISTAAR